MLKSEMESEISRLQKLLQDYRSKKKNSEEEQRELNTIISKIRQKTEEIDGGLQETIRTIVGRLDKLNPKSKFKITYLEKAKGFLQNSSASSAVESTREAERIAKKKYLELDDTISGYNRKIFDTEQEIETLKSQLAQIGE